MTEQNKKGFCFKKNIINLIPYFGIFICTTIIYYCVFSFWKWNINVPISFSGDTITDGGTLTFAAKALNGDGILSAKCFWTIDNRSVTWNIIDGSIHYFLMWILSFFIHSVGKLTNIYFIITYGLCGSCMYYVLTRLDINKKIAFSVAILYAFLPGHTLRGLGHMGIGSCFALPLIALTGYNIAMGEFENLDKRKVRRMLAEGIVGAILVGGLSIYFCFFTMLLHGCCIGISLINKRGKSVNYSVNFLLVDGICAFFTVIMPNLFSKGDTIQQIESTRALYHIRVFGLNIAQLLLPISGHRIPLFSKIRYYYTNSFGENENAMSSMGAVFSLAFLVCIIVVFIDKTSDLLKKLKTIGMWIILITLISVVGGFAEIIGFFLSSIRCYNRMSFLIACFSAIGLAIILDKVLSEKRQMIYLIVCVLAVGIGVLDQTSPQMKMTDETASTYESIWNSEEDFFDIIAETGAKQVLIYPSAYSGLYSENDIIQYDIMKSYIHKSQIKFSVGYKQGSKTDLWIQALEQYSTEQKLKLCATQEINGILLYKSGFRDPSVFESMCISMKQCVGKNNVLVSDDGEWVYVRNDKYLSDIEDVNKKQLKEAGRMIISNRISLGKTYNMGQLEVEPLLVQGFSFGEGDYRWSQGKSSLIDITINEKKYGDLIAELSCCYIMGSQSIKIYANDNLVYEDMIDSQNSTIKFPIERAYVKNGQIQLKIVYSNPQSPSSLGGESTDTRELAIAWTTMKITDTDTQKVANSNYYDDTILKKYLGR